MTIARDYDELAAQAERDYPESWIPSQHGPTIVGEFVRLESGHTAFGDSKIVILKGRDDVERSIWLLHSVLRNEFARQRPKAGELVAVRHLGRKQGAGGNDYEAYRVVVKRDASEPDWDALDDGSAPDEWGEDATAASL